MYHGFLISLSIPTWSLIFDLCRVDCVIVSAKLRKYHIHRVHQLEYQQSIHTPGQFCQNVYHCACEFWQKKNNLVRELLSDNFISPFGASFASTIENQQIESINISVDEEERSDITPVDITPVAKNRLSTPGNQSILSSGSNSSPGNVISRLSNLSSVQPKTKPVFFARKSAPIVPPPMATQSMYVTPAPVPELSGNVCW